MQGINEIESARRLAGEEVEFYHQHGYLKIERLVSPEFAAVLLQSAKRKAEAFQEDIEADFNGKKEGFRSAMWDNLPEISTQDDVLWAFAHSVGLATVHAQLLASPRAVRYFYSQLLPKQPADRNGLRTPWHHDFPYASFDRTDRPAIWMALTDMPAERGTLRFLDGSHRLGLLGRLLDKPNEDAKTRYPEIFERLSISPPFDLKAGDATVHHPLTVHGAPENSTDETRWTFLSQYIAADTLFTGARPYLRKEFNDLTVGSEFDHPDHPIIPVEL